MSLHVRISSQHRERIQALAERRGCSPESAVQDLIFERFELEDRLDAVLRKLRSMQPRLDNEAFKVPEGKRKKLVDLANELNDLIELMERHPL